MTSHLQRIQNYKAGVFLHIALSATITRHLKLLHWFSVKVRSTYRIVCLCYHCYSSSHHHMSLTCFGQKPSHSQHSHQLTHTMPLLNRPAHSKGTLGNCLFSFASSSIRAVLFGVYWSCGLDAGLWIQRSMVRTMDASVCCVLEYDT